MHGPKEVHAVFVESPRRSGLTEQRLFTPDEVDALIPQLRELSDAPWSTTARRRRSGSASTRSRQRIRPPAAAPIDQRDWKANAERLDGLTIEVREALEEIAALGGVTKDLETGLVDFLPGASGTRPVNLCWKHGETAVRFWHGFDEGYAQRKPLP